MEIIIAEDELISRNLLQKIIENFGHTVFPAENGLKAWELFQKTDARMVITDWLMPEMDGLDLCRKIREANTPYYVYIIIVTAKGQREDSVKGLEAGADDYIVKPYNPEELIAHIRSGQRIIQLEEASSKDIERRKKLEESLRKKTADLERAQKQLLKKHEDLKALLTKIEKAKKEWESTMDCIGEMVIVIDDAGKIQRCNRAFKDFAERPYNKIKGEEWKDLLHDVEMLTSPHNENSIELYHKPTGRWFVMNNYPYQEGGSNLISWTVITISENTDLKLFSQELQAKNKEIEENEKALEKAYAELKSTQAKIIHSEKMASIGQLAAGVAHEINNPTGFISSNLNTLEDYEKDLTSLINCYKAFFSEFKKDMITAENQTEIFEKMGHMAKLEKEIDLDFILEDTPKLIKECQEGARRIKQIVFDLKDFAHPGDQELKYADINKILDSTLNIVWNEIKYKATVDKNYGDLPDVQCYPQQLNQVFMNVLVNAAQAIEKEGKITIATRALNGRVEIAISDTGVGIPKENIPKIFDPFYTTKDVGKGTGLGLNVAYNIIKKHQGSIYVNSEVGKGTTFTVRLKIELEMEN